MVYFYVSILFFVLGYLVKYKKWSFLIAGYNTASTAEKARYNTEALCNSVGNTLFILGVLLLVGSMGEFLKIEILTAVSGILFTIILIGYLIYANTGNRFK